MSDNIPKVCGSNEILMLHKRYINCLPVTPPCPAGIKAIREEIGSQRYCASLIGIDRRTWERYEYQGDDPKNGRTPNQQTWGLFLLAVGKHPYFKAVEFKGNENVNR